MPDIAEWLVAIVAGIVAILLERIVYHRWAQPYIAQFYRYH